MIVLALLAFSLVNAADNTGDVPTLCSDVESTGDEESPCVEELSLEPTEEEQPSSPLSVEDEDDDDYDTRGTYYYTCLYSVFQNKMQICNLKKK